MTYVYQLFYLAQAAFTIWMVVDAYRRRAEYFWFFLILFVPGIGAWAYFFAVKAGDFNWSWDWLRWQRRPSLAELRYRAEHVPTLTHRLDLAERLVEQQEFDEAVPHLEAVLAQEPGLSPALSALALCHHEQGRSEQAVALLEKIIARDSSWSDYAAWRSLIKVRADCGQNDRALAAGRELVRVSPSLQHQCLLAECLLAEGLASEAGKVLDRALEDHQYAPGFVRRRNRPWASRAKRLRKQALTQ